MSDDHSAPISYSPTAGLTYDPDDARYWDPAALRGEVERTFEICHGCRLCFKYCTAFPSLFSLLDGPLDGDVRRIRSEQVDSIMAQCFQCKLCEVQCPYTVRDGHEYQLDFPKLVHRHQALAASRRSGGGQGPQGFAPGQRLDGLRRRVQALALSDPDRVGRAARASRGLADRMNRIGPARVALEAVAGIDRRAELPPFARQTFDEWADGEGLPTGTSGEVVLFPTCYVQYNQPDIGRDTVDVFRRNQVEMSCPRGLQCCGMPAWERGDLDLLRRKAAHNLEMLLPHVRAGQKVVAINPTCSMMLRRDYPELVARSLRTAAAEVAAATVDPGEFLWSIRNESRFDTGFRSTPGGRVAYHAPCHLRAQGVGFRGRDLLRKIPGVTPQMTMECSGHDGTFALRSDGYEVSVQIGKRAFEGMAAAEAEVWVSDCPLAGVQFGQHAGHRALHPMTVLARAYRSDGFPTPLPTPEDPAGPVGPASEDRP